MRRARPESTVLLDDREQKRSKPAAEESPAPPSAVASPAPPPRLTTPPAPSTPGRRIRFTGFIEKTLSHILPNRSPSRHEAASFTPKKSTTATPPRATAAAATAGPSAPESAVIDEITAMSHRTPSSSKSLLAVVTSSIPALALPSSVKLEDLYAVPSASTAATHVTSPSVKLEEDIKPLPSSSTASPPAPAYDPRIPPGLRKAAHIKPMTSSQRQTFFGIPAMASSSTSLLSSLLPSRRPSKELQLPIPLPPALLPEVPPPPPPHHTPTSIPFDFDDIIAGIIRRDSSHGSFPDDMFDPIVHPDTGHLICQRFKVPRWEAEVRDRSLAVVRQIDIIKRYPNAILQFYHNRTTAATAHPGTWTADITIPRDAQGLMFLHRLETFDIIVSIGVDAVTANREGWLALLQKVKPTCQFVFLCTVEDIDYRVLLSKAELESALKMEITATPAAINIANMLDAHYRAREMMSAAKQLQLLSGGGIWRITIGERRELVQDNKLFLRGVKDLVEAGLNEDEEVQTGIVSKPARIYRPKPAFIPTGATFTGNRDALITAARQGLMNPLLATLPPKPPVSKPGNRTHMKVSLGTRVPVKPKENLVCTLCERPNVKVTNNGMCGTCDVNWRNDDVEKKPCSECKKVMPIVEGKNPDKLCIICLTRAAQAKLKICANCKQLRSLQGSTGFCFRCVKLERLARSRPCKRCKIAKVLNHLNLCEKCNADDVLSKPRPCLDCKRPSDVMRYDFFCKACTLSYFGQNRVDELKAKQQAELAKYEQD